MKYLFDSSSIFRPIEENEVEVLTGEGTLARANAGKLLFTGKLKFISETRGSFIESKKCHREKIGI